MNTDNAQEKLQNSSHEQEISKLSGFQLLLFMPLLAPMIWGLSNRSETVIYHNTFYVAIPIFLLVTIVFITSWIKGGYKKPTLMEFVFIILSPILIYGASIFYYGIGAGIMDAYKWMISPTIPKRNAIVLAILATLLLGIALWYFRLKRRAFYGLTETMIGLTVVAFRALSESEDNLNTPEFYLALLTAGIYLVVRGLDNIHQGLTKEPVDPWGFKIYNMLKAKRFYI